MLGRNNYMHCSIPRSFLNVKTCAGEEDRILQPLIELLYRHKTPATLPGLHTSGDPQHLCHIGG